MRPHTSSLGLVLLVLAACHGSEQATSAAAEETATPTAPLEFGPQMTHPLKRSGDVVGLTPEAISKDVHGLFVARCVVTVDGRVENCRTVKPLPYMEQEVMRALSTWRMTPATLNGRPVAVDYTFRLDLQVGTPRRKLPASVAPHEQ